MQEEFQDQITVVRKLPFKGIDIVHPAQVGYIVYIVLKAKHGDFLVPAAIHNCNFSTARDNFPITPQVGFAFFQFGWSNVGINLGAAWIEV